MKGLCIELFRSCFATIDRLLLIEDFLESKFLQHLKKWPQKRTLSPSNTLTVQEHRGKAEHTVIPNLETGTVAWAHFSLRLIIF